jgi:hypothetical protein
MKDIYIYVINYREFITFDMFDILKLYINVFMEI